MTDQAAIVPHRGNVLMHIKNSLSLSKIHLSLFVAFSSYFGFLLNSQSPQNRGLIVASGVFFLSCACSTLNNIQDRHIDALHERTRNRPFPQEAVSIRYASAQFYFLVVTAFSLLSYCIETPLPALIGLLSLVLYNGCYTPLKKRTLFAMVPGTICGMLPPLIGWTASGGQQPALIILIVMMIFGVWQIPHTWIIILRHFNDSSETSIPGFFDYFSQDSLKRILFVWVSSFAVLQLLLISCDAVLTDIVRWIIVVNAVGLISGFASGLFLNKVTCYRRLFIHLNLSLLLMMLPVFCERILVVV